MKIAAIENQSLADYPGRMAAVIFTPGCNWNCFYCHNRSLAKDGPIQSWLDENSILDWLEQRRGWLDAVVITGGEPTLQPGLADFIRAVRAKGFLVKLDTNGTRPEVLRLLLRQRLLNYVAMDVKAPMDKYEAICGVRIDHALVNESIDLLLSSGLEYEFRTTVVPQLSYDDVLAIARRIRGARRYVLQQYRRPDTDLSDVRLGTPPHTPSWPHEFMGELSTIVARCETRGFQLPAEADAPSAA
ncbi:MAG: anaerobic ribonucleoside-triphosphate reductase activating protein [Nitrospiraceae bacterium]|nr:anaerobic ribonucleoside-triphosphate reductase activating protein [Nitrospiraceae bacterium]